MKFKVTSIVFAALAATTFFSVGAQAGDFKSYPGKLCEAYFGNQVGDVDSRANGTFNRTNSSRWVSCAIIKDNHIGLNGISGLWVNVNTPTGAPLRCHLRSVGANAAALPATSFDSDVTSGANDRWLFLNVNQSRRFGQYCLYCLLPQRASITAYHVREHNSTDIVE